MLFLDIFFIYWSTLEYYENATLYENENHLIRLLWKYPSCTMVHRLWLLNFNSLNVIHMYVLLRGNNLLMTNEWLFIFAFHCYGDGLIIDNRNCWCSSRINARHDRDAKDVWMKGENEGEGIRWDSKQINAHSLLLFMWKTNNLYKCSKDTDESLSWSPCIYLIQIAKKDSFSQLLSFISLRWQMKDRNPCFPWQTSSRKCSKSQFIWGMWI